MALIPPHQLACTYFTISPCTTRYSRDFLPRSPRHYYLGNPWITAQSPHSNTWKLSSTKLFVCTLPPPTGLSRKAPLEGVTIGDVFVTGGVEASTPTYSLHRDPRYFVDPERFVPERWITGSSINFVKGRPEMIIERTAFLPFGFGPYGSTGKHLAYVELKLFVAPRSCVVWR